MPFNVAHAAGNFAIALAAGPALVRMISRFRTRLEFRWPRAAVVSCLAVIALVPASASASTRSWVENTQNEDGGFAATAGQPSSPAMTGWVMLGLEAAGRNPLDLRSAGNTPVDYLREEIDRVKTATDLERTILALAGAGIDPRSFEGFDLVKGLRRQKDADGSVNGQVNMTAFYVLALRAAGVDSGKLKRSVRWLRAAQGENGGWGFQPQAPSDPDSTGAALQALGAVGARSRAVADGVRYLEQAQQRGGGFALSTSGVVNAQSTAWAAQGLVAVGAGGSTLDRALRYLRSQRAGDGHYRYSESSDQTPIWVTAQVLLAVNGTPLPLPAVARAPQSAPQSSPPDNGRGGSPLSQTPAGGPPSQLPQTPPITGPSAADIPNLENLPQDIQRQLEGSSSGANEILREARGNRGGAAAQGTDDPATAEKPPFTDEGRPIVPGEEAESEPASSEPTSGEGEDRDASAPWVVAGLGGLAAALGLGFLWYRRRLP